jgi:hypothetical protein
LNHVNFAAKTFCLPKHYNLVMTAYSFKEVTQRLLTAAAMKWMKRIGRSSVERAAAAALPDLRRHFA